MEKNPKKITIRDKEKNIKSIQEYKYNEYGDPVMFKKMDSLGKIIIHWIYEYKYDKLKRKTMMKISDVGAGKETTMDYEY